jgi:hypothetical protein
MIAPSISAEAQRIIMWAKNNSLMTTIIWILSGPQKPYFTAFVLSLVLLRGGRIFKRWSLGGGVQFVEGTPFKGTMGPWPDFFLPLPNHEMPALLHCTLLSWCAALLQNKSSKQAHWSWTEISKTVCQNESYLFNVIFLGICYDDEKLSNTVDNSLKIAI